MPTNGEKNNIYCVGLGQSEELLTYIYIYKYKCGWGWGWGRVKGGRPPLCFVILQAIFILAASHAACSKQFGVWSVVNRTHTHTHTQYMCVCICTHTY